MKIEYGILATLGLAIVAGALYVGQLDGKLQAITTSSNVQYIEDIKKSAKEEFKSDVKQANLKLSEIVTSSDNSIKKAKKDLNAIVQSTSKSIESLKSRTSKLEANVNGTLVYSCPSIMPSGCDAAQACQSMCTGQLQINKSTCTSRGSSGVPIVKNCSLVGRLVKN